MNFRQLGLIPAILNALGELGYETPTPIQAGAIPPALEGRDVLGIAQTGTGKTCAFATPILQRLAQSQRKGPRVIRALILTPTRELALQIQESFDHYGKALPLRSAVIFGGVGQGPQVEKIRRGLDILVATPGRLLDLQGQGLLDLAGVEIFVLDEADRMLDMGFIHDVRRVLKLLPQQKQTLFFSATMPPEVTELVNGLLHDPARVAVTPVSSPVEAIEQHLYFVDKKNKTKLLALLVSQPVVKNALVFSRTKHGANKIAQDLQKAGISAAAIHGNKSQSARQQALGDFKAGRVKVLVATDIAARGIDIEDLSHVFNYNLPDVPETYVHRIGRTGRAGREGVAITFCEIAEMDDLKAVEKLLGRKIPVVEEHPWPMEVLEVPPKEPATGGRRSAGRGSAQGAPKRAAKPADGNGRGGVPAGGPQKPTESPKKAEPPKKAKAPAPRPVQTAKLAAKAQEPPKKSARGVRREDLEWSKPKAPTRQVEDDFYRPDPLAGDAVMDATARLLAPRKVSAPAYREDGHRRSEPKTQGTRRKPQSQKEPRRTPERTERLADRAAHSAVKAPAKRDRAAGQTSLEERKAHIRQQAKARRAGGRGPIEPTLRPSTQKDSTEQESLMKPYYMGED